MDILTDLSAADRDLMACLCAIVFGGSLIGFVFFSGDYDRPWIGQAFAIGAALSAALALNL